MRSPLTSPARLTESIRASSLPRIAQQYYPSAIETAPVRVATSTMASGLKSCA
jgi:hypothetical protein